MTSLHPYGFEPQYNEITPIWGRKKNALLRFIISEYNVSRISTPHILRIYCRANAIYFCFFGVRIGKIHWKSKRSPVRLASTIVNFRIQTTVVINEITADHHAESIFIPLPYWHSPRLEWQVHHVYYGGPESSSIIRPNYFLGYRPIEWTIAQQKTDVYSRSPL